jgi:hypothetical protein
MPHLKQLTVGKEQPANGNAKRTKRREMQIREPER